MAPSTTKNGMQALDTGAGVGSGLGWFGRALRVNHWGF
jgi:hypothetical protein